MTKFIDKDVDNIMYSTIQFVLPRVVLNHNKKKTTETAHQKTAKHCYLVYINYGAKL